MLEAIRRSQFKRDVKLAEKRGKDMAKLRRVLFMLINEGLCQRVTEIVHSAASGSTIEIVTLNLTGS